MSSGPLNRSSSNYIGLLVSDDVDLSHAFSEIVKDAVYYSRRSIGTGGPAIQGTGLYAARVPKELNEGSEIIGRRRRRRVVSLLVETESAAGRRLRQCLSYLELKRVIRRGGFNDETVKGRRAGGGRNRSVVIDFLWPCLYKDEALKEVYDRG